ncbi:MAG: homoserine kinase [Methylobacter sp.]|nr:homoserine kinase [Methylobacter sp.]
MSVFTRITRPQLNQFFSAYTLGEVISFEGITDGIDNTNYEVITTQGSFVLTLFESLTFDELPHFLKLLAHLGKNSLLCPCPQSDRQKNALRQLHGKPAAIFKRLSGLAIATPSILHCQEIGLQLASLHRCTQDYVFPIKSGNDLSWCKTVLHKIDAHLSAEDRKLIDDELAYQTKNSQADLPRGVIHGDLFRDNALFVDDRLSGLLDFYSACTDTLLLDVAIAANDWCCDNGTVNDQKFAALLAAYESLRPLEPLEEQHWPTLLRAAALRFWLSRLEHHYYPRPGEMTQQKDPLVFRRILGQHRQSTCLSSHINTVNLRSTA